MTKSTRFKEGMVVLINSNVTGCGAGDKVTKYGYKKGDKVTLIKYDNYDESWKVKLTKKKSTTIWIKRKNLAPIPVKETLFKVDDKVVLTTSSAQWASNDKLEEGLVYVVKQVSTSDTYGMGKEDQYIKVSGHSARGVFWIESKYFKPAPVETTEKHEIKVMCIDNTNGYENLLTVGQIYQAAPGPSNSLYSISTPENKHKQCTAYKRRFVEVKEDIAHSPKQISKPTTAPKVGDVLTAEWLNKNTPKNYLGFSDSRVSWKTNTTVEFIGDRQIEKIEEKAGRMAALISDTDNIWIDVADLKKKDKELLNVPVPQDILSAFLTELETLIAKYK